MLRNTPGIERSFTSSTETVFLHIAPCGDHWTGSAIYAAKHNPSGYVKSLPLPPTTDFAAFEETLSALSDPSLQEIYDTGCLPAETDAALTRGPR